jgi:prefoldin subunit 5
MIKWLKSLITSYNRVKELESEIEVLNDKIDEKQDIINKTNAYWKKKLYHQNKKTKES